MTHKVMNMLEQVSALKEYLEENCNELSDTQALKLRECIDNAWTIADRRTKVERRTNA